MNNREDSYFITGDFNDIVNNAERRGVQPEQRALSWTYDHSTRKETYTTYPTQGIFSLGEVNEVITSFAADWIEQRRIALGQRCSQRPAANT